MKAVTVVLQTMQPLLATSLQGDPNSSVSYPYIPGSMLRGALIERYMRRRDSSPDTLLDDTDAWRLFFDGSTRYLNAYPFVRESRLDERQRLLPAPRSWFLQKGTSLTVGKAVDLYDRTYGDVHPASLILKGLAPDTYTGGSDMALLTTPRRRINIHTARARVPGRSISSEGALFRYDAIDVGQYFQAVILCETDTDAETVRDLLAHGDLWFGGSRSAGYGHVAVGTIVTRPVDVGSSPVDLKDAWVESASVASNNHKEPAHDTEQGTLVVTLLSDLIARNMEGQHQAALPLHELAVGLGLGEGPVQVRRCFAGSTLIGGFNRAWGLPLPQMPALIAGSVFVLDIASQPGHDRIQAMIARGLGERRVDGFGRIAIGWPARTTRSAQKMGDDESDNTDTDVMDNLSTKIAVKMADRLLRNRLEQVLLDKVARTRLEPLRLSNSQISLLAIVARRALTEDDGKPSRGPIDELLNGLPANARRQYQSTRVATGSEGGKRFDQQIREWLDGTDPWLDDSSIAGVGVAGQSQELSLELRLTYGLRLIMAAAKRASKEQEE